MIFHIRDSREQAEDDARRLRAQGYKTEVVQASKGHNKLQEWVVRAQMREFVEKERRQRKQSTDCIIETEPGRDIIFRRA